MNCGGGSVGPATYFFVTDGQKRDYLSHASQRARGATKKHKNHTGGVTQQHSDGIGVTASQ